MGNSRREDKILVGGYGIFLIADAIPSGPVYAIDEYILVDRLFSVPGSDAWLSDNIRCQ